MIEHMCTMQLAFPMFKEALKERVNYTVRDTKYAKSFTDDDGSFS